MAKVYHVKHSPAHHIRRELRDHRESSAELISALIESNKQLRENITHVLKGLNELVSALKSAGEEPEFSENLQAETPTTAGSGDRLAMLEQQVKQLSEQNRQIIEHLKRMRTPEAI